MNFDQAFTTLLGHEGGYSNNKADPGGETMWGVTKAVAKANGYYGDMRLLPQSFAKAVYKRQYWDAVKADQLPDRIRYLVFDAAVNSGATQSAKWLQRAVGVTDDGVIGAKTIAAANAADPEALANKLLDVRFAFMQTLSGWPTFKNGWTARINSLRRSIQA